MRTLLFVGALAALGLSALPAWAQQDAEYLAKAKEFFWYQCYVCHVFNDPDAGCPIKQTGQATPKQGTPAEEPMAILVQNAHGPDLCGVLDAPAGRRVKEGFQYSNAFAAAAPKIVWTEENLDKWLTNTQEFIPGAWMYLRIPEPEKRKMAIAFLKTYKAK